MTLEEARKIVQAEKPKDNYMLIPFGYDQKYVVPFKDGVAIINALVNAELFEKSCGFPTKIGPIDPDTFTPSILSKDDYQRIKMAMLLQVHPDELKKASTS